MQRCIPVHLLLILGLHRHFAKPDSDSIADEESSLSHGSTTVYLKNKLLNNLNNFFDKEEDELEILSANKEAQEPRSEEWESVPDASLHFPLPSITPTARSAPLSFDQPPIFPIPSRKRTAHTSIRSQTQVPPASFTNPPAEPTPPPIQNNPETLRSGSVSSSPTKKKNNRISHALPPAQEPDPRTIRRLKSLKRQLTHSSQVDSEAIIKSSLVDGSQENDHQQSQNGKKKRREGVSSDVISTIRKWRRRLYKAFKKKEVEKGSSQKITRVITSEAFRGDGDPEVLELNDMTPREKVEKPSRVSKENDLFSDKRKSAPLFGMEKSGYKYQPDSSSIRLDSSLPPIQFQRDSSSQHKSPFHLPILAPFAPPPNLPPFPTLAPFNFQSSRVPPPSLPLPTRPSPSPAPAPPPTRFPSLPSHSQHAFSFPSPPSAPSQMLPSLITHPPPSQVSNPASSSLGFQTDLPEPSDVVFGEIIREASREAAVNPLHEQQNEVNEDECNSLRLKEIIQANIVPNDADSSKKRVQASSEQILGRYYDTICGTGFFSYIAHTDEFCQASAFGVNCYVFSPVCSPPELFMPFSKQKRAKALINRN